MAKSTRLGCCGRASPDVRRMRCDAAVHREADLSSESGIPHASPCIKKHLAIDDSPPDVAATLGGN